MLLSKLTAIKCKQQFSYSSTKLIQFHFNRREFAKSVEELSVTRLVALYNTDNGKNILRVLNSDTEDLKSYGIVKSRANKLLNWRSQNGPFQDIQDVLRVEGFDVQTTNKMFENVLKKLQSPAAKKTAGKAPSFVTPAIDGPHRLLVKSIVSIRIGVSSVSWARLNLQRTSESCNCCLTHWHHHDITERKMHLKNLVQQCLHISQLIPEADCYVLENPEMVQASNNPGSVEQKNVNIQKAQVVAMITFAMNMRNKQTEALENLDLKANVYFLRRFLTARLFNNIIGNEVVSTVDVVSELISPNPTESNTKDSANNKRSASGQNELQFSQELVDYYTKAERYQKDFLGQTLLLSLTFVRLVLLRDAQSIAKLSRSIPSANL